MTPRIRYNVHDEGGTMDYDAVAERLSQFGFELARLGQEPDAAGPRGTAAVDSSGASALPLGAWTTRRDDQRHGSEHPPGDVEALIYRDSELAQWEHSFCLEVVSDEAGSPRPGLALELNANAQPINSRRKVWPPV